MATDYRLYCRTLFPVREIYVFLLLQILNVICLMLPYCKVTKCLIPAFIFVFNGLLLGNDESIKESVMRGYRPPLDAIVAPTNLMSSLKGWITLCWHREPDKRPSFDGK